MSHYLQKNTKQNQTKHLIKKTKKNKKIQKKIFRFENNDKHTIQQNKKCTLKIVVIVLFVFIITFMFYSKYKKQNCQNQKANKKGLMRNNVETQKLEIQNWKFENSKITKKKKKLVKGSNTNK